MTELCYHRHRRVEKDWSGASIAGMPMGFRLYCEDCKAYVCWAYECPQPDLPPLPLPVAEMEEAAACGGESE